MTFLVVINHSLAFLLELATLAAFALIGYQVTDNAVIRWIVSIIFVAVAIGLWGRFAAPNSETRLLMPALLLFKTAIFGAGATALFGAGKPMWAILFVVLVTLHLALAVAIDRL